MAGTGKKWLVGCGVGCGSLILISILFSVVGGFFFMRPLDRAVESQKVLADVYGEFDGFRPPARLDPERITIFVTIRRDMMSLCPKFEAITARFRAMDEIDDTEDPSPGQIFQGLKGVMGAVFGMGQAMGEVLQVRNEALQEHGMGLGEYTWIYVMTPNTGIDRPEGAGYRGHKLGVIVTLMGNHAEVLDAAGRLEDAAVWRNEAGRLQRVDEGVPFAGGALPASLARSLAPYRDHLEKTYCPAMAEFDLDRIEKKGMSYHTR